jgi:type VI secretion system protein ImpJ
MPVYLGVAALRDGERNTSEEGVGAARTDLRYVTDVVEVADENLGGAPQQVEVRKLRGRFFFGGESREGYECVKVAEVRRAGYGRNAPVLTEEFIPPVLVTSAYPVLAKLTESICSRLEAKHRFLRAEVSEGRINLEVVGGAGWQPVLKLQIVGSFVHVFRQLAGSPFLHPFPVYLEMARLAGELSIFDEEGADGVQIPHYDHAELGPCFHTAVYTVERLLERILSGTFMRVPFELDKDLLVARLKGEWLVEESQIYLCVESDLPDRSILSRIEVAKIGARADLPLLTQRRLFGLDIALLNRTPGGLPARENFHYFSIDKGGQYWESVVKNREVAIAGGLDAKLAFSLFVVLKPEPKPGR